jgi:hypothetical protein
MTPCRASLAALVVLVLVLAEPRQCAGPVTGLAAAIRDFVLETVAISPAVHRLALELTDRQAATLSSAISDTLPSRRR